MKHTALYSFALIIICLTIFTGCSKSTDPGPPAPTPASTTANTTKQSDQQGSSEADAAINDVNDVINNKIGSGASHKMEAYALPCGVVSLDSSTSNSKGSKIYKVNYGIKTPCGFKKKSGVVSFELINGTAFYLAGSVYKLTFQNYVVQSLASGDTVKINGTLTFKNMNGGYIWQAVTNGSTIVHQVRGTFTITYANGAIRNKSYYQLRTYNSASSNWAGLTFTIAGDTTFNKTSVYEIGRTYDGNYPYQIQAINSFVWSNCGTTYAGPYVLKAAHARMNVTVAAISPAYIDIEGGYYWNYGAAASTPVLANDCSSNAYKITTVIGTSSTMQYQLY
jgi:hypothetical protein